MGICPRGTDVSLVRLLARPDGMAWLAPRAIGALVLASVLAAGTAGVAQLVPVRLPSVVQHDSPGQVSPPADPWYWQVLPEGLIYRSYLAGVKEPRIGSTWAYDLNQRWLWEVTIGGRVGLIRYGTDNVLWPQGWQIDLEGAAFTRLDMQKHPNAEHSNDLVAADFRVGIPVTFGRGRWQTKCGYYHISSHLGDELILRDPNVERINYVRDSIVLGRSFYWRDDLRLYAEAAYAIGTDGGAQPWEFQFGIDYSPAEPTGIAPVPFAAINGHLREEVNFGGNLVVQVGMQWRGATGHLFRMGMQYYNGMSEQFEFYDQYESKIGMGIWYDH